MEQGSIYKKVLPHFTKNFSGLEFPWILKKLKSAVKHSIENLFYVI